MAHNVMTSSQREHVYAKLLVHYAPIYQFLRDTD
jgi:hypothetical protein